MKSFLIFKVSRRDMDCFVEKINKTTFQGSPNGLLSSDSLLSIYQIANMIVIAEATLISLRSTQLAVGKELVTKFSVLSTNFLRLLSQGQGLELPRGS